MCSGGGRLDGEKSTEVVPITARLFMGDENDFLVVVNGGLTPFDITLWQSCRLQLKSRPSAARERTVCSQIAEHRVIPKLSVHNLGVLFDGKVILLSNTKYWANSVKHNI